MLPHRAAVTIADRVGWAQAKETPARKEEKAALLKRILAKDPKDKNALILQFKEIADRAKAGSEDGSGASEELLRHTAKLLVVTEQMGEAHIFTEKLIKLEIELQNKKREGSPGGEGKDVWLKWPELLARAAAPKQRAFLFLKPHAATPAAQALVEGELKERKMTVLGQGVLDGKTIDAKKLVDRHYYSIASKATLLAPLDLPMAAHKGKFKDKFGVEWDAALSAGSVFNAEGACKELGCDAAALDSTWAAAKKAGQLVKFGGGFYCAELEGKSGGKIYVLNGFFMAMRSKYTQPDAKIVYYDVEWDAAECSWESFRSTVLGATDPAECGPETLRGQIASGWVALGLPAACDVGDNGVHGSASPFEAMVRRRPCLLP